MKPIVILIALLGVLHIGCTKKTPVIYCPTGSGSPITGHSTVTCGGGAVAIYKTKYNYTNNITVLVSDDQTQVLAFPGVTDVGNQRPVALAGGYYAQRMPGNVFLSYTIDQYAAHSQSDYTEKDFLNHIVDCAPFTEYWVGCGSATDTAFFNSMIINGQLSTYMQKLN